MKKSNLSIAPLPFVFLILLANCTTGQKADENGSNKSGEAIETRIGTLNFTQDFVNGYPTVETIDKLYDEMDFQRACQLYLWSIPWIGFASWQNEYESNLNVKNGQLVLMETYEEKLGGLTFNTTTPYVATWINLEKEGPFVIEIPEGGQVRGAAHNNWQIQITQATEEGKYLFYGPNQEKPAGLEKEIYKVFQSSMNNFFFAVRLMPETEEERLAVLNEIKIYPLSQNDNPTPRGYVRFGGKPWTGYQPRGMNYWRVLADHINREPVREVDRYYMAMLKGLGIEKGKEFNPDERQTKILKEAVLVGEAMAKALDFDKSRLERGHYIDGSRWHYATTASYDQREEFYQELDESAAWFYEAVTNDEAMHGQETGWGQVYMGSSKDSDGDWFDGGQNYVLHIPPNPPAEAFWSITLYDVSSRCIIVNDSKKADLSSRQELRINGDGTIDLYFGPDAPKGKESNWIQTMPKKAWFPYFRFYSPEKAFLDKTWILPDIEKAN